MKWLAAALSLILMGVLPAWGQPGNVNPANPLPARVVSLVPSATEVLFEIGAGDSVVGVTLHDTWPPQVSEKTVVGGFFSPSAERILALEPDLILLSDLHGKIKKAAAENNIPTVSVTTRSLEDGYGQMLSLGRIFGKGPEAAALVGRIRSQLKLIGEKIAKIPQHERRRVARLMGRGQVMAPGDDSFQNDLIRAAGGIPPKLGKPGAVVPVSLAEWTGFNPQAIYGCGGDRKIAAAFFKKPGWKDVEAVRTGRIFYFPSDLTCRLSPRSGHFVEWLSARLYPGQFSIAADQVFPDAVTHQRPVQIDLSCVRKARIVYSRIHDFVNKTLVVDLAGPMTVVSTLAGECRGIEAIGNHFCPMPGWIVSHNAPVKTIGEQVCRLVQRPAETTSLLFTGADMDHLSVQRQQFKAMAVYALVTAGASSNALRTSRDAGAFYEPGTINIILLTNMTLTRRAMTRAIITATEAKTAALLDLDIRSSCQPRRFRATGTGTDNIIVAGGTGERIENAGGHSKMGELIARAVYQGVQEALFHQNGFSARRTIFSRLKERHLTVWDVLGEKGCDCAMSRVQLARSVETVLLDPGHAGFLAAALAISDDVEKGLITDLSAFKAWARETAASITGRPVHALKEHGGSGLPRVERIAWNAILTGILNRPETMGAAAEKKERE